MLRSLAVPSGVHQVGSQSAGGPGVGTRLHKELQPGLQHPVPQAALSSTPCSLSASAARFCLRAQQGWSSPVHSLSLGHSKDLKPLPRRPTTHGRLCRRNWLARSRERAAVLPCAWPVSLHIASRQLPAVARVVFGSGRHKASQFLLMSLGGVIQIQTAIALESGPMTENTG